MANTLSATIDSITADRTTGVLLDGTTYSSPARADVGVFVTGQKMKQNSTVESTLTLTGDTSDPETDTQWTFNIPKDGWFRFLIVGIPEFDSSATYSLYDAVHSSGTVYRSKQNSNTEDNLADTSFWEEISDPGSLALNEGESNESTNIDSLIYEPGIFPNSEYGFAQEIAEASEEYLTTLAIPDEDLATYELLAVLLDGAYVAADRSAMSRAERISRRLESILNDIV